MGPPHTVRFLSQLDFTGKLTERRDAHAHARTAYVVRLAHAYAHMSYDLPMRTLECRTICPCVRSYVVRFAHAHARMSYDLPMRTFVCRMSIVKYRAPGTRN